MINKFPRLLPTTFHAKNFSSSTKIINTTNTFHYVDKTLLIKELIDHRAEVIFITRPLGWGKTLNMSMIHHFFAPSVNNKETKGSFDKFKIASVENGKYVKEHQGKYPVIHISFKDLTSNNFESFLLQFGTLIKELYMQHEGLLEDLDDYEKPRFKNYLHGEINEVLLSNSLHFLTQILYECSNRQRVFVLVDDYDTPLQVAYLQDNQKYLEDVKHFIGSLFNITFESNSYLQTGVLTGIFLMFRPNIFGGFDNFVEYTMLDHRYNTSFGFTDNEVTTMLEQHDLMNSYESIKQWYGGYRIDEGSLFHPSSIINCLGEKGLIQLYWRNEIGNAIVKKILTDRVKKILLKLINGETETHHHEEQMNWEQIGNRESRIWNFLYFLGYLTARTVKFKNGITECELGIPNAEVISIFKSIL